MCHQRVAHNGRRSKRCPIRWMIHAPRAASGDDLRLAPRSRALEQIPTGMICRELGGHAARSVPICLDLRLEAVAGGCQAGISQATAMSATPDRMDEIYSRHSPRNRSASEVSRTMALTILTRSHIRLRTGRDHADLRATLIVVATVTRTARLVGMRARATNGPRVVGDLRLAVEGHSRVDGMSPSEDFVSLQMLLKTSSERETHAEC